MFLLVTTEENNVQWLKDMGSMGRKTEGNYLLCVARLNELDSAMRPITIKDQEPILSMLLECALTLKIFEPVEAWLVIGIAGIRDSERKVFRQVRLRHP
jgi:hypothetical protein